MMLDTARNPSRIFLSYRRGDSIAHVNALFGPLRHRFGDEQVFKDTDDIPPGQDFVHVIDRELQSCSVLLAVIGKNWLNARVPKSKSRRLDDANDYLRLELATALKNDRVLVIPVLVGDGSMPSTSDLPPDLAPLARRNAFALRDERWESDVKELIDKLEASGRVGAAGKESGTEDVPRRATANRLKQGTNTLQPMLPAVAVIVALFVVGAGWLIWSGANRLPSASADPALTASALAPASPAEGPRTSATTTIPESGGTPVSPSSAPRPPQAGSPAVNAGQSQTTLGGPRVKPPPNQTPSVDPRPLPANTTDAKTKELQDQMQRQALLNQTLANLARRSDEVRQAAANLRGGDEPARRVGGNIKPPAKLTDVSPVYPPIAASARVEGVVIIEATIDESGRVTQARVLRSIPLLDQAAIDAVRQWTFAPTLVDGRAVPVIMTVSVNFSLQ